MSASMKLEVLTSTRSVALARSGCLASLPCLSVSKSLRQTGCLQCLASLLPPLRGGETIQRQRQLGMSLARFKGLAIARAETKRTEMKSLQAGR